MNRITLNAVDFIHAEGLILESAALLADAVVARLKEGLDLEISVSGLKGVSPSYLNVVLQRIVSEFGVGAMGSRVIFQFDHEVQRQVFQRSLEAFRKTVA